MYKYKARVVRIIDGDTIDVEIDLGFKITTHQRLRIAHIDTPELRSKHSTERQAARVSKAKVEELILNKSVIVETTKTGKYGRYIADVHYVDENGQEKNLGQILLSEGLAKPYGN